MGVGSSRLIFLWGFVFFSINLTKCLYLQRRQSEQFVCVAEQFVQTGGVAFGQKKTRRKMALQTGTKLFVPSVYRFRGP